MSCTTVLPLEVGRLGLKGLYLASLSCTMDTEIKKRGKQKNFFFIVVKESFYQSVLYEGREQVCQKSFVLCLGKGWRWRVMNQVSWQKIQVRLSLLPGLQECEPVQCLCVSDSSTACMNTRISEEQEALPLELVAKGCSVVRQLFVYFHNVTACNQYSHSLLGPEGTKWMSFFFLSRVHWLVPITWLGFKPAHHDFERKFPMQNSSPGKKKKTNQNIGNK